MTGVFPTLTASKYVKAHEFLIVAYKLYYASDVLDGLTHLSQSRSELAEAITMHENEQMCSVDLGYVKNNAPILRKVASRMGAIIARRIQPLGTRRLSPRQSIPSQEGKHSCPIAIPKLKCAEHPACIEYISQVY